MKRIVASRIMAAESGESDRFDEMMSNLKDDFDYALSGLEKLSRQGANGRNDALMIGENLGNAIQQHLNDIAGNIGGNEE